MAVDEFEAVRQMRRALLLEGRQMQKLTPYHVDVKYGYEPKSMSLAVEKNYVRYIHPNFMQRVADFMKSRGNTVVDGVVTAVYTDCPELGGVVAYTSNSSSAETIYVPYSKLVMSLGTQHVVDAAGRPLVESVHARSVTGLATVYLKRGRKMPPSVVIGSTNRVTNIAGPVRVTRNNQEYDSFLVRMTCGACIAPDVASNDSLDYDAVAATGLVTALRRWLSCDVDVISIWGSNRQLTKYGEICWFQVNNSPTTGSSNLSISAIGPVRPKLEDMGTGIYIQVGAGENSIAQGPSQAMHPR